MKDVQREKENFLNKGKSIEIIIIT